MNLRNPSDSILPHMFKPSNCAIFVRQLNKYDFHKVENTNDNTFGEQSWTFCHLISTPTDVKLSRTSNVKYRPLERTKDNNNSAGTRGMGPGMGTGPTGMMGMNGAMGGGDMDPSTYIQHLQPQITQLTATQEELSSHMRI
ncbi:hypothetical protein K435DRAFT_902188 [Dendrothele bispora CBS 962.96]|uniref:HSF-type DNA-binding domain-containing protein n=1 Tax=Dendrothele bispora (strain CBS 962.96) TaxID=1314807 RepID=A0A4S8MQ11_DENBC|nr:hypothetical protein K435DRAFT_902188 [Dendrothele bispora CBS 962.96]